MPQPMPWGLAAVAAIAGSSYTAEFAFAAPVEITPVALQGDLIDGATLRFLRATSALGEDGEVLFEAGVDVGDGGGLFSSKRGLIAQTGDVFDGKQLIDISFPDINRHGDVVFAGTLLDLQTGLFEGGILSPEELLVRPGDSVVGRTLLDASTPTIKDDGELVFFGRHLGGEGLFARDRLLVESGNFLEGTELLSIAGGFAANERGDLVLLGTAPAGPPGPDGIPITFGLFTQEKQLVAEGDTVDGKAISRINTNPTHGTLNDLGDIVYTADFADALNASATGVFTASGGFLFGTGEEIDGRTLLTVFDTPLVNNSGEIVFDASFMDANGLVEKGIFSTTRGLVAAAGDLLSGRVATNVSSAGLNDQGQIAFFARFGEDEEGIFLATPYSVNEPPVVALLAFGLILCLRTRN